MCIILKIEFLFIYVLNSYFLVIVRCILYYCTNRKILIAIWVFLHTSKTICPSKNFIIIAIFMQKQIQIRTQATFG